MLLLPERMETTRLALQRLKYEDAEEIFYAYASKSQATQFVTWPTHQQMADTRRYLRVAIPAWDAGLEFSFTIRLAEDNRLVGSIGAVNERGKVQFGYIVSPVWWNKGIATEACQALLRQLSDQQYVFRIWTFVDVENLASIQVLRKCGLVEEARLPRWHKFVNQKDQPKDCIFFRYPLRPS